MTLYISDLDGTLLNSAAKLKPRAADMINDMTENGLLFSYCTARSLSSAAEIMKDVKLKAPVALMNGAFIYDPQSGEYIIKNIFSGKQVDIIEKTVRELGESPMIDAFIDGESRNSHLSGAKNLRFYTDERRNDKRMRPLESYDGMFDGEVFYAVFIDPKDRDALDRAFTLENGFLTACYRDVYNEKRVWYEVFSASAGKANAVLAIKRLTGADETVCFGDNANDLPMFSVSDRKYAVANAIPELKAAADAVIGSNESCGVPVFIEKEHFTVFDYTPAERRTPDKKRFGEAVHSALLRERSTIGTLNEKTIHNALKHYYCPECDHEAKIGGFYADAAGENGIFEIQTANFSALRKKLSAMLRVSHVTVVYPYEKHTHILSVNEKTGELLSVSSRTNNSFSKLFLELYRIKAFLTNPNLTIRIALLETEKRIFYKNEKKQRRKGLRTEKLPTGFVSEIVLEKAEDYRVFLPEELPESFTGKDYGRLCRTTDASLALSVLEMTGAVTRSGKLGANILYKRNV